MAKGLRNWLAARAGIYRELPDYIRGLKTSAIQEIAYGESVIATVFAIYTYVNSISLTSVLAFFGASFVLAGYHIWRPYYLRLQPKLQFEQMIFQEPARVAALNNSAIFAVTYVQVLPRCTAEIPVEDCRGRLLRVLRMGPHGWEATVLNQPLDLMWSFHDNQLAITLEPGVDQRLNLFRVDANHVQLSVHQNPLIADGIFSVGQSYLFQVRVSGKDCVPIDINVRVQFSPRTPAHVADGLPAPIDAAIITHL